MCLEFLHIPSHPLHMHWIITLKQLDLSLPISFYSFHLREYEWIILFIIHRPNYVYSPGETRLFSKLSSPVRKLEASLIEKLIRFQSWEHSLKPYLLKVHNWILQDTYVNLYSPTLFYSIVQFFFERIRIRRGRDFGLLITTRNYYIISSSY